MHHPGQRQFLIRCDATGKSSIARFVHARLYGIRGVGGSQGPFRGGASGHSKKDAFQTGMDGRAGGRKKTRERQRGNQQRRARAGDDWETASDCGPEAVGLEGWVWRDLIPGQGIMYLISDGLRRAHANGRARAMHLTVMRRALIKSESRPIKRNAGISRRGRVWTVRVACWR
jgi:hypothetical protein